MAGQRGTRVFGWWQSGHRKRDAGDSDRVYGARSSEARPRLQTAARSAVQIPQAAQRVRKPRPRMMNDEIDELLKRANYRLTCTLALLVVTGPDSKLYRAKSKREALNNLLAVSGLGKF